MCAVLLGGVVAIPASAAGGFGELSVVGAGRVVGGRVAPPVAAVDARGDGAVGWSDGARVHVARRAAGGTWTAQAISRAADEVSDVQLVVARGGDIIAVWTETYADGSVKGGVPDWLLAAVAPQGRPFGRPQVIAKGPRADSALPRLASLADGRVVLIWRNARWPRGGDLRMALLGSDRRFGRSAGLGVDGVAPAVVATSDGGAVVSWASPGPLHAPRRLFAARLAAGGHRLGRRFEISPSAVAGARLAAGPDNVVMASWASRGSPAGLLAAQLTPRRGPVRVLRPGVPKATAAALAVGPGGSTLATFLARTGFGTPGFGGGRDGQWVASGTAAGGFDARVELPTSGRPLVSGTPAILPTDEALVAWSQFDDKVLVARKPAGSADFAAAETIGSGHYRDDSTPLVTLAQAAGHVLLAWSGPRPRGGMIVAERP
jgi:hypothetical protein